jgi:hypothetical protein
MSQDQKPNKSAKELTPNEREVEHLRRLRQAVEGAKSGVLMKGKTPVSENDKKDGPKASP